MTKEDLLTRLLGDLQKQYPVGLYEYLFKYHQGLYRQLVDLEDRIDQTYLSPNASTDALKVVLRAYWKLHMTAIKEFNNTDRLAINLPVAKQEMQGERIKA